MASTPPARPRSGLGSSRRRTPGTSGRHPSSGTASVGSAGATDPVTDTLLAAPPHSPYDRYLISAKPIRMPKLIPSDPLVSSEDELHLHGLLGMVVNQIERSLSLFRIKGLRDHGLRLQRAALEPLNDFREEMSVEPGPDKGQLLFDDLLLTDIAGCRREAEETNAAGRACDPASLLQKRSHPCSINDHRGTEPIHLSPRDVHHWHALRVDHRVRTEGPGSLQARLVRVADQTACPLQLGHL